MSLSRLLPGIIPCGERRRGCRFKLRTQTPTQTRMQHDTAGTSGCLRRRSIGLQPHRPCSQDPAGPLLCDGEWPNIAICSLQPPSGPNETNPAPDSLLGVIRRLVGRLVGWWVGVCGRCDSWMMENGQ